MNTIKIELTAEQINAIKNGVSTIELVQKEEVVERSEPTSLKWGDVVDKVGKHFFSLLADGDIVTNTNNYNFCTPTRRDAVKARALTQLLTVMHYVNGEGITLESGEKVYGVSYRIADKELVVTEFEFYLNWQIYFKTRELAEQAANDNRDLFIQYFTGEEVTSEQ
jgi:hypothetical protein